MEPLFDHPLVRETRRHTIRVIRRHFPEISSCNHDRILVLRKYVESAPERFYNTSVFRTFLDWIQKTNQNDNSKLREYFSANSAALDRAFLHLQEVNTFDWHDDDYDHSNKYELIRFIDRQVHPTYLRLVEAVYAPFIRIMAYFSRLDRGKPTDDLNQLWNCVEELSRANMDLIVRPYNHLVRNAIAHGGITYLEDQIRYQDIHRGKVREATYSLSEVVRLCDDMLDTCNGLALALTVFLLINQGSGYVVPRQLLLDELREETLMPWWHIVGCTPMEIGEEIGDRKQLVIHVRVQTFDKRKVLWSAFQTAILAEQLIPDFDRYFLSLHSTVALPGWAAFDGTKLRQIRVRKDRTLADYKDALEGGLLFYVPKWRLPSILRWLETIYMTIKLLWPHYMREWRERLGMPSICVRNARIHRNGWIAVLQADVVSLSTTTTLDQETIRKLRARIISLSAREARRRAQFLSITRYLPIGFARVSVFAKDYRRRRLQSFGLRQDLICAIQMRRVSRIVAPALSGSTVEVIGRYRIEWNRAWLQQCARS